MKRFLKLYFALNLICGSAFLLSCSCSRCDDCNSKYEWKSMNLKMMKVSSLLDGRVSYTQTDITVFQYNRFGVKVIMNGNSIGYSARNNTFFIQSCNAAMFDCFKDYKAENEITSIQIYSLSEFDDTHAINSDISEYFKAITYSDDQVLIDDLLLDSTEINGSHQNLLASFSEEINMILTSKPNKDSVYKFAVKITFQDYSYISDTTDEISIK